MGRLSQPSEWECGKLGRQWMKLNGERAAAAEEEEEEEDGSCRGGGGVSGR